MKHIVSFSGGRTSAYLVHLMEQKRKNEGWDVEYVFMDTGAEHPKTYEFIRNVVKHWGIELTCLKAVVNPEMGKSNDYKIVSVDELKWDLSVMKTAMKKYGAFTLNRPYCTEKLKTIIFNKYKADVLETKYKTWLGIRADEPRRIKFTNANADLFKKKTGNPENVHYLAFLSDFEKQDILQFWQGQEFDLEIQEHEGNCVFCVKKSLKKIALAQRDNPELYDDWLEMTNSNDVRIMPADKFGQGRIYRQWHSPEMVIASFKHVSDTDLKDSIYKSKETAAGSCTESCEVFGCQIDMFEGDA